MADTPDPSPPLTNPEEEVPPPKPKPGPLTTPEE